MNSRKRLRDKLQTLFLTFRNSPDSIFDDVVLKQMGVDSCEFDLIAATPRGGMYFRPMSQECLNVLVKRPDMQRIPFWPDQWRPSAEDSYMVQDAINDQLRTSRVKNDLWTAYESTQWEPVGLVNHHDGSIVKCAADHIGSSFGDWADKYLQERDTDAYSGGHDPTRQTYWSLLDVFATKDNLPHQSCMACHEIRDVTGPTRSELMILTGLMIISMYSKAHLEHDIFPVCLSVLFRNNSHLILDRFLCCRCTAVKVASSKPTCLQKINGCKCGTASSTSSAISPKSGSTSSFVGF